MTKEEKAAWDKLDAQNKKRQWLDYIGLLKCERCEITSETHPVACFDFHHNGDKEITMSDFTNGNLAFSEKNMVMFNRERQKCSVLCATCHRRVHDEMRKEKP